MVPSFENVTGGAVPTNETLDIDERFKLLRIAQKEYRRAGRARRTQMLDELAPLTGLHRKSLIRALNGPCERQPRRTPRGRIYGAAVEDVIRIIAETHDYICAERLQPNLVQMADDLTRHGELALADEVRTKLGRMSPATLQRMLTRLHQDLPQLKRRRVPPPPARRGVPMRRIPWDEPRPGYLEVDLVHHSGPEARGEYVHTLHLVDVATGWCEAAAVLGRSYLVVRDGFMRCLDRLPFPVLELHTDNGSEFFNAHLERFYAEYLPKAQRSRNRPYQKNDARFVEQRNGDLIRRYLGDERLDTAAQTILLNAIYVTLSRYHNLFQPVLRLQSKTLSEDGGRIRRRYSPAQTPFARLCAAPGPAEDEAQDWGLPAPIRERLGQLREQTNPRVLRRQLYAQLDALWRLPSATAGQTEDVYATLFDPTIREKGGGRPQ